VNKVQTLELLAVISSAYPNVDLTEEQIMLWQTVMSDVDFREAQKQLVEHIKLSKFPPTIAEIRSSNSSKNANQLAIQTKERLQTISEWDSKKLLLSGGEKQ